MFTELGGFATRVSNF